MAKQIAPSTKPTLIFHLQRQPLAPHFVRSDQASEIYSPAKSLWALTRKGTIGCRFHWSEPDGISRCYKVIDRREEVDAITVTCIHVNG